MKYSFKHFIKHLKCKLYINPKNHKNNPKMFYPKKNKNNVKYNKHTLKNNLKILNYNINIMQTF